MKILYLSFLLFITLSLHAQNITFADPDLKAALIGMSASVPSTYAAKGINGNDITVDANEDGEIQVSEALLVYELNLIRPNFSYPYINDLGGIDQFLNLKVLICPEQQIGSTDLTLLANLEELNCEFNLMNTLNISGLQNLRLVKCRANGMTSLNVHNCTGLENLDASANNLSFLNIGTLINLDILGISNNNFSTLDVTMLLNLEELICDTNNIATLNVAGLPNLKTLLCNDNNISTIELTGLPNLETLDVSGNNFNAIDLSILPNLKVFGGSNNLFTSLDFSYPNLLTSIACSNNYITALDFSNPNQLTSIYCSYNNISNLDLAGCSNLITLECTNNQLTAIDVSPCVQLLSLNAIYNPLEYLNLKNGYSANYNIYVGMNPSLQYVCVDENELEYVSGMIQNMYPNCIVNAYCSFTPGGLFYTHNATSSYDIENDGCENNTALPFQSYLVSNSDTEAVLSANAAGSLNLYLQTGTHTVTAISPNTEYYNVSPGQVTVTLPGDDILPTTFCLTALDVFHDFEVKLLPTSAARPGFDCSYRLICTNRGTSAVQGSMTFSYMDDVLDVVSSTISPNLLNTGSMVWHMPVLQPFENFVVDVTLNLNSPVETPSVDIDDQLDFMAVVDHGEQDYTIADNEMGLKQTVVGSYDPNDKTCLEGKSIPYSKVGDFVHYVIRFENTGNYFAENIIIKDFINPEKFDISSLKPISGSHSFITRTNNNHAHFEFENIMLAGLPNENRHGYVAFKIKTRETLEPYETFSNSAEIYFDYNAPVVTNNYITTVGPSLSASDFEFENEVIVYPNPAANVLKVKATQEIKSITVYNTLGQRFFTKAYNDTGINVSALMPGIYILKIETGIEVLTMQFLKN